MKEYDHTWLREEWERMNMPEVEIYDEDVSHEWIKCDEIHLWQSDMQYRIKCKPYINWDHVHKDINALVMFPRCSVGLYVGIPEQRSGGWIGGYMTEATNFASFIPGTCRWQDSLVTRPVIIGE